MNNLDLDYQNLLKDILENGVEKKDRTGTGTLSVFGRQIRHNMKDGFPLLTTKKMAWKTMVVELLWFLRGETNIKFLLDYDCHIWDGDAYKRYMNVFDIESRESTYALEELHMLSDLTKEEFTNRIKTDDEFAKKWGDLGPIYGKQWRRWRGQDGMIGEKDENGTRIITWNQIDQISNLINDLKTNPDSRRLMVNAWNVAELDQMVLPPCHYGFQMYTRELSLEDRLKISGMEIDNQMSFVDYTSILDGHNIPTRSISLMWNQRSCDFPLGIPMNIASYGLLLEIISKEVNMVPDELIGNFGDCHIYLNQINGVKEQIGRNSYELPKVKINERNWYIHEEVKKHLGEKTFDEKLKCYRPDCFELIGYESHPKIYFPLSN
jgi:thymidylate synthase